MAVYKPLRLPPCPDVEKFGLLRLSASGTGRIGGALLGSSGSDPKAASTISGKPSPSLSAVEFGFTTVKRLLGVIPRAELPKEFVATKGNVPACVPTLKLKVAEVPEGLIDAAVMVIVAVWNENVAPAKFEPVTVKLGMTALKRAECLLIDVMTGTEITVKLLVD